MGGEAPFWSKVMKEINENVPCKKMTRGTKALIKEAIKTTQSSNRFDILTYMTDKLEERFPGATLDYQLRRMNLETTGKILEAIDTYAYHIAKTPEMEDEFVD